MAQAARWLVVVVVALACAAAPVAWHALPAHQSTISATDLARHIRSSDSLGYSGEVRSQGSLQVPLTGSTFGGVSRLLGGSNDLRVWWGDDENWRVDRIRTSGEEDLVRNGQQTTRWTYESGEAKFIPYSAIRLPDDADALPPQLAARLLAGAHPGELSRLPARRVAGHSAAGLRLVPSDPRTTIGRVDVWADEKTGLPLRVAAYAKGKPTLPVLSTELISLDLAAPTTAQTSFELGPGMHFSRGAALDEAAGANAYAPFRLPDTVAGLPRRGNPDEFGAVGVYGRGPTALLAVPLRGSVSRGLRDQLAKNSSAQVSSQRATLRVGPLSVLVLAGRDGGLLLTGTVTPTTLDDAAGDLIAGIVRVSE